MSQYTIIEINVMKEADFVSTFGSVFEHSPWVAQRSWNMRPFDNVESLHKAMCEVLRHSLPAEQLALIIAHPDLGDRLGGLTAESTNEQASAGLDLLTQEELDKFNTSNAAYKTKFGFPFVICARLNNKSAILSAFEHRLQNTYEEELYAAQVEIEKIAALRLQAIVL